MEGHALQIAADVHEMTKLPTQIKEMNSKTSDRSSSRDSKDSGEIWALKTEILLSVRGSWHTMNIIETSSCHHLQLLGNVS